MGWNGSNRYSSDGLRRVRHTCLEQACDWLKRFGVPGFLCVGWNMIGVNVEFSVLNGHLKQVLVPFISNEQFMLNKYIGYRDFQYIRKIDGGVYLSVSRCTFFIYHVHCKFLPIVSFSTVMDSNLFFYKIAHKKLPEIHACYAHA